MQPSSNTSIAVLGAGSWGTALAVLLAKNGLDVRLWDHNTERVAELEHSRCNQTYLPDIALPANLHAYGSLQQALENIDHVLFVVPSHALREVLIQAADFLPDTLPVCWATKGLETSSGKLMHQVVTETLGENRTMAVLSGPTFAMEVARGLPTAITVATNNAAYAGQLAEHLHNENFRAYTASDIIGVQVGGAIKNVLAIASGIADGLGFGANTRAALITRGLAEIMRLGVSLGGQQSTFMGLAGLGDLVLTCTDDQSRNRRLGLGLAKGRSLTDIRSSIGQEVEGVQTAHEALALAAHHQVEMPITEQVVRVLSGDTTPRDAVHELLMREQVPENY